MAKNKAEYDEKIVILAKYLNVDIDEIEESEYDNGLFIIGSKKYLILNNEDADQRAADYIRKNLWTFNGSFIVDYTKLPSEAIDMINNYTEVICEDANDTIGALIDNIDDFINDAICEDGRGIFISTYDIGEREIDEYFIYRMN